MGEVEGLSNGGRFTGWKESNVTGAESNVTGEDSKVLEHLFGMAENYRANNSPNSAIEMYFMFISDHPDTVQATMAKDRLMSIAKNYEKTGLLRQARALYEQLL